MKYQIDNLKISPLEDDKLASIIKNKYLNGKVVSPIYKNYINSFELSGDKIAIVDTCAQINMLVSPLDQHLLVLCCLINNAQVYILLQTF